MPVEQHAGIVKYSRNTPTGLNHLNGVQLQCFSHQCGTVQSSTVQTIISIKDILILFNNNFIDVALRFVEKVISYHMSFTHYMARSIALKYPIPKSRGFMLYSCWNRLYSSWTVALGTCDHSCTRAYVH